MRRSIAALTLALGVVAARAENPPPSPLGASDYRCSELAYPIAALRIGVEGTTTLLVTVDDNGAVVAAEVAASSGDTDEHVLLDRAAVAFALTCRHAGASTPVAGRYTYRLQWIIE